jgi:hypothetical protein
MNVAVAYLGRRVDRLHVAGLRELARWPLHGLVGAIAFRFDNRTLELVRLPSFDRPSRSRPRA